MSDEPGPRVGVVIPTRNRRSCLLDVLDRHAALPERPPVIVVDNGSDDGTAGAVRHRHPDVPVIELGANAGAAARNVGARLHTTPYVAFSDDDSWWEPGALGRATDALDRRRTLALVAARVLVGDRDRLDPASAAMAASPLPRATGLPGPPVLGFLACGAVVRRSALLATRGFHPRYGVGGEEQLIALDLAAAGWDLAYMEDVVVHHHPSPARDTTGRRRQIHRNDLWSAWLRRPLRSAARLSAAAVTSAVRDSTARRGLLEAVGGVLWVARERRVVPVDVEAGLRALENAR